LILLTESLKKISTTTFQNHSSFSVLFVSVLIFVA
jgi:hypothetical protein